VNRLWVVVYLRVRCIDCGWSCIYVLGVSILHSFYDFSFGFWNAVFFFHFILIIPSQYKNKDRYNLVLDTDNIFPVFFVYWLVKTIPPDKYVTVCNNYHCSTFPISILHQFGLYIWTCWSFSLAFSSTRCFIVGLTVTETSSCFCPHCPIINALEWKVIYH
jgi:hypothetical protein